ncbi:DUF7344 domain-containing protein [Haloarcula marina]|uniref:DUF7344 domain-containing protein n=1 Tax=Haloarcula marina TaxID=2961574 RepID=UPI0020B76801|nr:hypothetical protein [Halomicroarcula marina]
MDDTSDLFELLASTRRRQALVLLCDSPEIAVPEGFQTRTEAIEEPVTADSGPVLPSDRSDPVIELYHSHLPKLDAADLVDWDRQRGVVSRGPAFGEVRPVVELLAENAHELPDGFL